MIRLVRQGRPRKDMFSFTGLIATFMCLFALGPLAADSAGQNVPGAPGAPGAPGVPGAPGLESTLGAGFIFDAAARSASASWLSTERIWLDLSLRHGNVFKFNGYLEASYGDEAPDPLQADRLIRELSLAFNLGHWGMATAGKQRLEWGTARVFSSIDTLEAPIDPADPDTPRRGVTGLRIDIFPTWFLGITALAVPARELENTLYAGRLELLVVDADIGCGAIRAIGADGREEPVLFADFAWFGRHIGVYGEGRIRYADSWQQSVTGGLQYETAAWLNGTLRFVGEYRWRPEHQRSSHLWYGGISGIPLTVKTTCSISALAAPVAGEYLTTFSIDHRLNQTLTLRARYDLAQGQDSAPGPDSIPIFSADTQRISVSISAWF